MCVFCVYDGGSRGGLFTGRLNNPGAGVVSLSATGTFSSDGTVVIDIGTSTVGMKLIGHKVR